MNWRETIVSDPQVLRGKPCIAGTRIPAALVLGYLAAGRASTEILTQLPGLRESDVMACLNYARELADFESEAA